MTSADHQTTLILLNEVLNQNFTNFTEAEIAFERKYANEYYKISEHDENVSYFGNVSRHQTILEKYGDKLTAISIESFEIIEEEDDDSSWLIKSLIRYCTALKKIELAHLSVDLGKLFSNLPNLTHCSLTYLDINDDDWTRIKLPNLKYLIIKGDIRLNSDHFAMFIENNRQIESLELNTHFNNLEAISGKLKALKHLKIEGPDKLASDQLNAVEFDSLESLNINCIDIIPVLKMFRNGCNNIKKLDVTLPLQVFQEIAVDEDALTAVICLYEKTTAISIENVKFTQFQIEQFGKHLQHLTSLSLEMKTDGDFTCQLIHLVPIFTTLIEFSVKIDVEMMNGLNYDFHQRFLSATANNRADFHLTLISQNNDQLIFSKETIHQKKSGSKPILIHWIGYETASSVSKVNILDLKDNILKCLFDRMDLISLNVLKQTCRKLKSKVIDYVEEIFQTRTFICNAGDNIHELRHIFQSFGQYFRILKIQVPALCEKTEVFGLINRFCKNVTEISLINHSFTNGLISPVQFELPQLEQLSYQNYTSIDLEIGAFANCARLQRLDLELRSCDSAIDEINVSFLNQKEILVHFVTKISLTNCYYFRYCSKTPHSSI